MRNDTRMRFIPRNLWYYKSMLRFMECRSYNEKNLIFIFFFFCSKAMKRASTDLLFIRELMRLNDGSWKKDCL